MTKFNELLSKYEKTWIWSDPHFFHKNIIKYCDRPFNSVDEMNAFMKKAWQDTVGPNDLVINCGDFTFGSTEEANKIIQSCPGYKVLIIGNHDYQKRNVLRDLKFDLLSLEEEFEHDGFTFLLTHVPLEISKLGNRFNIHGHIHNHTYVENFDTEDAFESPYHACVSVEHTNYKPKLLTEVCDALIKKNEQLFTENIV